MEPFTSRAAYVAATVIVVCGLYVLLDRNLLKKVLGLNLFQTGVFLFFVAAAYRTGGDPPLSTAAGPHVNPLPHVLILTAIVVGVSVTALALGMVVVLYGTYGTVREDEIREAIDE